MWFGYKNDNNWYSIPTTRVVEIMEMNKAGKKPVSLEDLNLLADVVNKKEPINNELDRLDKKLSNKPGGSRNKKGRPNPQNRKKTEGNAPRPNPNQKNRKPKNTQNVGQANTNQVAATEGNGQPKKKKRPNRNRPNRNRPNGNKGETSSN